LTSCTAGLQNRGLDVVGGRARLEAVERACSSYGVSSHVLEVKPFSNFKLGQVNIFSNAVHRIAGGAKDSASVCFSALSRGKDQRLWVAVVEEDAVEGLVYTIIDIVEELLVAIVFHATLSKDIDCQCVRLGNKVSARFSNDLNFGREKLVQQGSDGRCNVTKGNRNVLIASRPASSQVEQGEIVANTLSNLEKGVSAADGLFKRLNAHATTSNVEGDTDNVQVELFGSLDERLADVKRCTKLGGETADGLRIVSDDAKNQLGLRIALCNLVELILVVKGHHLHSAALGVENVRLHLGGVGIDDAGGSHTATQNLLDLGLAGTVKVDAKAGQGADDGSVGVALNGKEGLDTGQVGNPFLVLSDDGTEVNKVEGFFGVASTVLQLAGNELLDGLADRLNVVLVHDFPWYGHYGSRSVVVHLGGVGAVVQAGVLGSVDFDFEHGGWVVGRV